MKPHNSTKLAEAYKNIKQTIQKETRKAYITGHTQRTLFAMIKICM